MSRSRGIVVQNDFKGGLNTDITGLTFPENSCTETDNCIFTNFGNVKRRGPFDIEEGSEPFLTDIPGKVIVTFVWDNVAGEGDVTFVVVQVGNELNFYQASSDTSLSSNYVDTIDLSAFYPSGVTSVAIIECQFASGNGLLFVTNPRLETFYVSYDSTAGTFSTAVIDIKVRDFEGDVADTSADAARPTVAIGALNAHHRYNLENQGWTTTTLTAWDTARTDMPSNCDVSWYFKSTTNAFDFTLVDQRAVGNSLAPKGHFLYSVYDVDRSSNVASSTDYSIDGTKVSNCAFFAGRVFYSGLNVLKQNSRIFFSQIVDNPTQYGRCYQTNDPTSEELFDLLPSDGGVIDIISAGNILKMMPMYSSLIIFCTNGIWQISGSDRTAFAANNYTVTRIATVNMVSHTAFIDIEGVPYWLTNEGVFTLSADQQSNALRMKCITDGKIRNFILDILAESKQYSRGVYDPYTKTAQWLYRSTPAEGFNDKYKFDRILILNLITGGWYNWSINTDDASLHGVVNIFSISGSFEPYQVIAGAGNNVIAGAGNNVINISNNRTTGIVSVNKYLVNTSAGVTFAEHFENDTEELLDWKNVIDGGHSYDSYFVTGYAVHGQAARKFQTNYVHIYSEVDQEVNNSYKILGRWNYAVAASTGKWTTSQVFDVFSNQYAQTVNVNADSYKYKPNRIKIRGHGRACQFKVFNNETNPFNIIGWAVAETGNQWI